MSVDLRANPVRQRRHPHQGRSERRVEEILNETARLLEQVGPDRLTTNLIARRLGMSVGTLYHYFPNRHAILYALGVRWLEAWQQAFDEIEQTGRAGVGMDGFVDATVDRMLKVYRGQHGVLHLVQGMFTIPELRELDTRQDELAVARLTALFRRLGVRGPARECRRLARVYIKLVNAILPEVIKQRGRDSEQTLADLKALLAFELRAR